MERTKIANYHLAVALKAVFNDFKHFIYGGFGLLFVEHGARQVADDIIFIHKIIYYLGL